MNLWRSGRDLTRRRCPECDFGKHEPATHFVWPSPAYGYRGDMNRMRLLPTLGSTLAGAVGFLAGYYAAFFVVLSIWGLDFDASILPLAAGIPASVIAGGAIALTVSKPRRLQAFLIAVALGLILTALIIALNADAGAMLVGGAVAMALTALIVRSGVADQLPGT